MSMLFITLAVMLIVVLAMSIGVIFGRQPIKGSCGGVGKALGEKNYRCEICGGDETKCEEQQELSSESTDLSYNAAPADNQTDTKESGSK